MPTITATGGGHENNPHGQNRGAGLQYGTGFAASVNGNGTSAAYIYPGALSIWEKLANTPLVGNRVGGGAGISSSGYSFVVQPGAVFLLIQGVVYY